MISGPKMKNQFKIETINQLGFVVRDLEKATELWENAFGVGPFQILERPPEEIIYRDRTEVIQIKNGLARLGSLQLELIEVVQGKCCQGDFLEQKGEGLHHIGIFVDDLEEALTTAEQNGMEVLQKGTAAGSISFAYLDTLTLLGIILEFIQIGKTRRKK